MAIVTVRMAVKINPMQSKSIIVLLTMSISGFSCVTLATTYKYVRKGGQVTLPCPFKNYSWITTDSSKVFANFNQGINPALEISRRLSLSPAHALTIYNVTDDDFRMYRCLSNNGGTHDIELRKHGKV